MIIFPCVKSRKNMQPDMWLRLVNVPLDNVHLFSVFFYVPPQKTRTQPRWYNMTKGLTSTACSPTIRYETLQLPIV